MQNVPAPSQPPQSCPPLKEQVGSAASAGEAVSEEICVVAQRQDAPEEAPHARMSRYALPRHCHRNPPLPRVEESFVLDAREIGSGTDCAARVTRGRQTPRTMLWPVTAQQEEDMVELAMVFPHLIDAVIEQVEVLAGAIRVHASTRSLAAVCALDARQIADRLHI